MTARALLLASIETTALLLRTAEELGLTVDVDVLLGSLASDVATLTEQFRSVAVAA